MPSLKRALPGLLALSMLVASACLDVREFQGSWSGSIIAEEALRQGFADTVKVDPLVLSNVDLLKLSATLTTSETDLALEVQSAEVYRVPQEEQGGGGAAGGEREKGPKRAC